MAQLITVRLNKADHQPLGFRLQGGKDFGTPLVVQKVNGGSAAERAGLQAGDALIRVNSSDVYSLRHQEAQDTIRAAGGALELTVQRGGGTWRPAVTPTGSLPRPNSRPLGTTPTPVTNTSLKAPVQPNKAFGSGHNNVAKPYSYMNGNDSVKSVVNKQYNTPVNMYSDQTIAETLSAQTEVLAGGVLGVNFKKNEKTYDAEKSAVFKVLQEAENDPEPEVVSNGPAAAAAAASGLRHVTAPVTRPDAPLNNTGGLPVGQNICEECERLITGVFVRIKDKNLHVECFKCATCGSSLKNQGYYNLNGKLYCDIHAKLVARQQPPGANLEPVTVPPGGKLPTNAYSTPLPPLSTNTYTNGSSSMFSPSTASNLSGPKPFGSSIGSAYSPSLSPRSAPMSPARPVAAPAPAPTQSFPPAPAPAPHFAPAPAPLFTPAPAPNFAPSAAPAAPFAPTNESSTAPYKQEFKSPAEERLIRKMAKMALNGYEIGIQRKIKPADHIQSMADRIQDTVVTKHPLSVDNVSSGDSSREGTLKKSSYKNMDKGFKSADSIQSIGEKIKANILNHHPINKAFNGNAPIPPPIPNTPIPSLNGYSSPKNYSSNEGLLKIADEVTKELSPDFLDVINNSVVTVARNGNESKNQTIPDKETTFEDYYRNTLKKSSMFDKPLNSDDSPKYDKPIEDIKPNNNYSNTLNKKSLFEKLESQTPTQKNTNGTFLPGKTSTPDKIITDTLKRNKDFNSSIKKPDDKPVKYKAKDDIENQNQGLPINLHDNSLYDIRAIHTNATNGNGINPLNGIHEKSEHQVGHQFKLEKKGEDESETIVKRRPKRVDLNADGRRDSHIIARPLSTMTAADADVTDALIPPVCHKCEKVITRGPFITALGRIWCPDHFICVNSTCRRPLQDIGFVEENGQLYCEFCFEQYIAPACSKCQGKIKGDCLNAIGKHFHPECFNCVYCGKLFGNNPFFLEDGLPYCESDWNELFTTKCFACGFPVEAGDRWVEALSNNYHSQCFNCTVCKKNLEGQSFFAKGGRPFCKMHAR